MWLLVGLGNPGRRYEDTRHNAGFRVVERLAARWGLSLDRERMGARVAKGRAEGQEVLLVQPQSFMNLSGEPVSRLRHWYKVPVERVLVVHDDLDLPFGQLRLKRGGGSGGHRGVQDVVRHLGPSFPRLKFGVGRPPPRWDAVEYVLAPWTPEEQERLDELLDRAADAVEVLLREGLDVAMNRFNLRLRRRRGSGTEPDSPQETGA